eukprot:jgi/Chlat1/8599/Chrsp86S07994
MADAARTPLRQGEAASVPSPHPSGPKPQNSSVASDWAMRSGTAEGGPTIPLNSAERDGSVMVAPFRIEGAATEAILTADWLVWGKIETNKTGVNLAAKPLRPGRQQTGCVPICEIIAVHHLPSKPAPGTFAALAGCCAPDCVEGEADQVFVNPYGGKRMALNIWLSKVAPLFELAGIQCHVIQTQRAGHARDHMAQATAEELNGYDGVVVVGGDGLFNEVLNGLLWNGVMPSHMQQPTSPSDPASPGGLSPKTRAAYKSVVNVAAARRLRIGVIPAGSTDTISYSANGTRSQQAAALHVVVGDRLPLDVACMQTATGVTRYAASFCGYGFYGEVMKMSESYRWMGPARYDFAGTLTFLRNRSFEARISFLPRDQTSIHGPSYPSLDSSYRTLGASTVCRVGCCVCQTAQAQAALSRANSRGLLPNTLSAAATKLENLQMLSGNGTHPATAWSSASTPQAAAVAAPAPVLPGGVLGLGKNTSYTALKDSPSVSIDAMETEAEPSSPTTPANRAAEERGSLMRTASGRRAAADSIAPPLVRGSSSRPSPSSAAANVANATAPSTVVEVVGPAAGPEQMRTIQGKFMSVGAALMTCRNDRAPMGVSTHAHLGDGYLDLILIKECSRLQQFRQLLRIASKNADPFDFHYVEVHKTQAFHFQPVGRESAWNCDGELLPDNDVYVHVHHGLVSLFARGPEE